MKITVHSRKSFSDSLKEQATNLTDEESNPSDSNADDSHSDQESEVESQHYQSTFGGVLTVTGDENHWTCTMVIFR